MNCRGGCVTAALTRRMSSNDDCAMRSATWAHWDEFDYVIINDELNQAVADLEAVLAGCGESCSTANVALRRAVSRIVG